MKKPNRSAALKPAVVAASFLVTVLPASAQEIFNGDNTLSFEEQTWEDGFLIAFGEDQDGRLDLISSAINSQASARLADSDESGTTNTAELNLLDFTLLEFASDGTFTHFGYDGEATVNIEGESLLRTRRAVLGTLPGASGTVNIVGSGNEWNHSSWPVEVGRAGTGEINVLDGGQISLAQSFVIGGMMFGDIEEAGGTGMLNVSGSETEINFFNSDFARLAIGSGGTGAMTVSEGATVNVTGENDAYDLWVGRRSGGEGTLDVNSGGVINADGVFRVASVSSNSSTATIEGDGSELNVEKWAFVGNTDMEGTVGTLNVTNGGAASIANSLRVGNQEGATGVVNVDGGNSAIDLGTFLQLGLDGTGTANVTGGARINVESFLHVGQNGNGTLNILDGGQVEVAFRPETTFGAFIGREEGAIGTVDIAGSDSRLIATHSLFLGSDPDGEATGGTGTLIVRDNGTVTAGSTLHVRGNSSILLNGASIDVDSGSFFQDDSSLAGEGDFNSDLNIESEVAIQGSGAGIAVSGALSGNGTVENVTLGGINSVASAGPLHLNNVSFSEAANLELVLDDVEAADLIFFDEQTGFTGSSLVVSFDEIDPNGEDSFALFNFTGSGEPDFDFTSVTTPEGWFFEDGWLIREDAPPGETFEDWAASHGLSGDDAATDADPDGDGFTNVQEFAFGTNPTEPDGSLAQVGGDTTTLTLRWNRSEEPGIVYVIEKSDALADWSPVEDATPVVMDDPDATPPEGYERVEWSVDISDEGPRAFFRVTAEIDPSLLP